jgi:hypothetical protein
VQAEYANKLLFIATLAFAKLSIISLLMILTESDLHRRLATAQTVVIALWGIVSEFVPVRYQGTVAVHWTGKPLSQPGTLFPARDEFDLR